MISLARANRRRRWLPVVFVPLVAAVLPACHRSRLPTTGDDGGTSGAAAPLLGLTSGTYLLELTGYAASFNPQDLLCSPAGVPNAGTDVVSTVELALDGAEWVARSAPGALGLELRLRDAGRRDTGGEAVSGTATGSAADMGLFRPARDLRVTIRGADGSAAGVVSGVSSAGVFLLGRIAGAISFSDNNGATSTCPAISWTLQRMPGR